jgi:hypothetical protein
VSLSWRDEVRIALTPGCVALARISRRWQPKIIVKQTVECSSNGPADWRGCIEGLRNALQEPVWHGADASVVISNHFVRYAVVPWSERLVGDEEKLAWVSHHFVELYGETNAPAEYRWSETGPHEACVASAIELELLAQVNAAFQPTALKLTSIQPYLMAAFNRLKRRVRNTSAWMVLPENDRLCIAGIAHADWQFIAWKPIRANTAAEVSLVLERELLVNDHEAPAVVLVYGADSRNLDVASVSDIPVMRLAPRDVPGYSAYSDAQYTMALTGVL